VTGVSQLDPTTSVIVGVRQTAERIEDVDYRGLSSIDLVVTAAHAIANRALRGNAMGFRTLDHYRCPLPAA
jgi:hypothetical protein